MPNLLITNGMDLCLKDHVKIQHLFIQTIFSRFFAVDIDMTYGPQHIRRGFLVFEAK